MREVSLQLTDSDFPQQIGLQDQRVGLAVQAGQEIVTSGVFKLRTGAAVTINNDVKPSNNPAPKPEDS